MSRMAARPGRRPALLGLKAAVVALVLQALIRVGGRAIKGAAGWWAAGLAFVALTFTGAAVPADHPGGGAVGWALGGGAVVAKAAFEPSVARRPVAHRPGLPRPSGWRRCCWRWRSRPASVLAGMGGVFSLLAVVSFGGACTVLAYVGQAAGAFGWLAPGQMLDELGLAETTPGPLVLVLVFVGFVGAYQSASPEWAWVAALAGGLMAAWTTFAPSFLWILRRRTVLRAPALRAPARPGPGPGVGGGRRGDRQSGGVVRDPPAVPDRFGARLGTPAGRAAGPGRRQPAGGGADGPGLRPGVRPTRPGPGGGGVMVVAGLALGAAGLVDPAAIISRLRNRKPCYAALQQNGCWSSAMTLSFLPEIPKIDPEGPN